MPKISYLVSSYDSGQFLNRRLNNLLNEQTEKDIEVIIINPNSPGTDDIIARSWLARDNRIIYINLSKREPYGTSWLWAWREANAPYVCNANTDDFIDPTFTNEVYHAFQALPDNIAFLYPWMRIIDESMNVKGLSQKPPYNRNVFKYECWAGPMVTWRTNLLDVLDFNLLWKRSWEHTSAYDYYLWLSMLKKGFDGYCLPKLLATYVQRPNSIENRRPAQNTYESLCCIAEFFPECLPEEFPEFKSWPYMPIKEEWIKRRMEKK